MTDIDYDDQGPDEIVRRAPQRRVVKKKPKKPQRRTSPREEEVRAEAPLRRNAPRPPTRPEGTREATRDTPRRGAVVAVGHGGERLTRRRISTGDKFDIPKNYVPKGWSYQWNTVTVLNQGINEIIRGDLQMHENGWRAVPASRHPGHWTPPEHEGSIVVEGLRLEERPESLSVEAHNEDVARAKALVRDRTDALRLTQRQLPGATVAAGRGNAGGMKMSIDPGLDIPMPDHQIDDGSE